MRISYRRMLPLLFAVLLLAIFASRTLRLGEYRLDIDEIWAIWQSLGTPSEIVLWTSPTETPIYFLLLGAWRVLVGMHPIMLRTLTLLIYLVGCAFMFRATRRLYGERAAWFATLLYGALAVNIFLSMYARSYSIAIAAFPLALWCTSRYFDKPSLKRGFVLALTLLLLYAATITAVPAFALLGVFSIVAYGRNIWRWWLPGAIAFPLALPDIIVNKLGYTSMHLGVTREFDRDPLFAAISEFFRYMVGDAALIVWIVFTILALVLLFVKREQYNNKHRFYWMAALIAVPIVLYVLDPMLNYYTEKRYAWWYALSVTLALAIGLSRLPKAGQVVSGAVLVGVMFVPFQVNDYGYIASALNENFAWLRGQLRAGDVILRDPNLMCEFAEEWDYYTSVYFPNGLEYVDDPAEYRRIWYVQSVTRNDVALARAIEDGRIAGRFVGPPECLFRLYEAPPNAEGILFENGMRFHGMDILQDGVIDTRQTVRRESEDLTIRLWWSVDDAVTLDYSVGVYLLDKSGRLVAQDDSAPQVSVPDDAPSETTRWRRGQYYIEERTMKMPTVSRRWVFDLMMSVYWFEDGKRVSAPDLDENLLLPLREITMVAW